MKKASTSKKETKKVAKAPASGSKKKAAKAPKTSKSKKGAVGDDEEDFDLIDDGNVKLEDFSVDSLDDDDDDEFYDDNY